MLRGQVSGGKCDRFHPFFVSFGHNLANNSLGTANRGKLIYQKWSTAQCRRFGWMRSKVHSHSFSAEHSIDTVSLSDCCFVEQEARTERKKQREKLLKVMTLKSYLIACFWNEFLNVKTWIWSIHYQLPLIGIIFFHQLRFFVCSLTNRFVQSSFPIFVWHLFSR